MKEKLFKEYEKAFVRAKEGKRVVLYVEICGCAGADPIVLIHSEVHEEKGK